MKQVNRWYVWVVLAVLVLLMACGAAADVTEGMQLNVPVTTAAKTAPTATPPAPAQHWLLAHGETATLLCGGTPKAAGIPAGQLSMAVNGVDSVAWDCAEWEGGQSAAAIPGEADQHLQLAHGQTGYALCGGEPLDGIPAGQWEVKVNGVDSVRLTCEEWEGGE